MAKLWQRSDMLGGPYLIATAAETGEKFIQVGAETAYKVPGFPHCMSKSEMEAHHLDRYRHDYLTQRGAFPFDSVVIGNDPPDFVVTGPDGEWGLDCVVFADSSRRRAAAMMRRFRRSLQQSVGSRNFTGIQGCQLAVRFSDSMDALPPKVSDQDAVIESLLDAMATCRYDREAWAQLNAEIADDPDRLLRHWPDLGDQVSLPNGAGFYANVICSESESHLLPSGLGFEIALDMHTCDLVSELLVRLTKLVTDHDKPCNQQLLITAGGPDKDACCYPEEETTARFLLEENPDFQPGGKGLEVKHLRQIAIHSWSSQTIVDLPLTTIGQ
ncbi:hypothetical protein [Mycolicibacterium phocaicum]|uniref:Uncharacterized protein n=1 Tax=Mycolicibacterium phocaicum TaxID=319706 RepID=A0AA94RA27_9MYCO|nr:hypothetical protein [Mycolicibacterium phocaicum]TLH58312.1 hypothetical protein C1S79_27875 [Mycolicibacterium phocaicum]